MSTTSPRALKPEELRRICDPSTLQFKNTTELEPLRDAIGQDLAMRAVRFGLEVDHPGYNVFALGLPGSGRATMIRQLLKARAADEPTPPDWCYVYNFDAPREPAALTVPAGRGPNLRDDVDGLLAELQDALPKALQLPRFPPGQLIEEFHKHIEDERYVALVQTPTGWAVVPALGSEPLDEKSFGALPEDQRGEILERRHEMEKDFGEVQRKVRETERDAKRLIIELLQMVAEAEVAHCVDDVKMRWGSEPQVIAYLDRLAKEVIENADQFSDSGEESESSPEMLPIDEDPLAIYRVNVIVCHTRESGAPVVDEFLRQAGRAQIRGSFQSMLQTHVCNCWV